jgi:IS5 family transposase
MLMFKILVLQSFCTLWDDAIEFQIGDRLSCMRFLRMGLDEAVPDATTIWRFGEQVTRADAIKALFAASDAWLMGKGHLAMPAQIIGASIIAAPR